MPRERASLLLRIHDRNSPQVAFKVAASLIDGSRAFFLSLSFRAFSHAQLAIYHHLSRKIELERSKLRNAWILPLREANVFEQFDRWFGYKFTIVRYLI